MKRLLILLTLLPIISYGNNNTKVGVKMNKDTENNSKIDTVDVIHNMHLYEFVKYLKWFKVGEHIPREAKYITHAVKNGEDLFLYEINKVIKKQDKKWKNTN